MKFVADVMREGIHRCSGSTTLREVARTMSDQRIHCVIVNGSGVDEICGVVSDLDLARGVGGDVSRITAGEAAASEVVTIPPSATIEEAAQTMVEHEVSHLIVALEDTGQPIGVVSTLDIARAVAAGRGSAEVYAAG
jgi:predicted transcriptional regulator